jgi:putative hydrolase of the HAD superfamily
MNKIKAIIFDLDNTLIEFLKVKKKAQDAAINAMIKAGMKVDKHRAKKIMIRLLKKYGIEYQKIFDDMLKEIMGKVDMRILAAGVVAYRRVKGDLLEPYPNVVPTLKKLSKRVESIGIVTDAPKFQAWTRLYEMKLDKYFDFVFTPDDTGSEKPSGLPFKAVMKMLGLRPDEILVVGDWMSKDIIPAQKLCMRTAFAKYGAMWKEKGRPDFVINDISELLKIV